MGRAGQGAAWRVPNDHMEIPWEQTDKIKNITFQQTTCSDGNQSISLVFISETMLICSDKQEIDLSSPNFPSFKRVQCFKVTFR